MKKIKFILAALIISTAMFSQVGIQTATPSATLDIVSSGSTNTTKALEINNSAGTEMVTVLDNGNVGIGTSTPERKLDVNGEIQSNPTTGVSLLLSKSSGTSNSMVRAEVTGSGQPMMDLLSTAGQVGFWRFDGVNTLFGTSTSTHLDLHTNNTFRMRVDGPTGNVSINKASTTSKLAVSGLPTYADDAAAGAGGLTSGDFYKTAAGDLKVKL